MYCVGTADNLEVHCDIIELEIERVRTLEWTTLFGQSNIQLKKVYIHTYVAQTSTVVVIDLYYLVQLLRGFPSSKNSC